MQRLASLIAPMALVALVLVPLTHLRAQTINGRTVTRVTYQHGDSDARGEFAQQPDGSWVETNNVGTQFRFAERNRDEWSVYLYDASRRVAIQLDLHRREVILQPDGGERGVLYRIVDRSDADPRAVHVDPNVYYRLGTVFTGPDHCLDVYNGGQRNNMTHLVRCADLSGQYWRLLPQPNGYYRLTTMFRGEEMCLDVYNGGPRNNRVHLVPCANYTGQFWRLRRDGNGVRMTTRFRGDDMCLDVFNGGVEDRMPHLVRCANFTGQYWELRPTDHRVEGAQPQQDHRRSR